MWPAQSLILLGLLSTEAFALTTKLKVYCSNKKGSKSITPILTLYAILTIPFYGFKVTLVTPKSTVTPKKVSLAGPGPPLELIIVVPYDSVRETVAYGSFLASVAALWSIAGVMWSACEGIVFHTVCGEVWKNR